MIGRLMNAMLLFALYFCGASAAAQAVGVGFLYARGALTGEKLTQYAAVLYGVDLPPTGQNAPPEAEREEVSLPRTTRLEMAARRTALLTNRNAALLKEKSTVDQRQRDLETRTERYDLMRKSFDELLNKLETDANGSAVAEVQQTLEMLPPAQAKDLFLRMLSERSETPDEALEEVANILRAMSSDKLKKILAEFKTDPERDALHRLLVHIGDITPTGEKEQGT